MLAILSMQESRLQKIEKTALDLIKNGLSCLSEQDQTSDSYDFFRQAVTILEAQIKISPDAKELHNLLAVAYNNLAIYYKRTQKPKVSLSFLKKALEIELNKIEDWMATSTTHLNICAIYSYLSNHSEAIVHAQLAVQMALKAKQEQKNTKDNEKSLESIIMASKYNLGVEYEHLKKYEKALECYQFVKDGAEKISKHQLVQKSVESIKRVKEQIKRTRLHVLQILEKKKANQLRGNYQSMCRNKKNTGDRSVIETRSKRYEAYNENSTIRQTKSMEKLPKVNDHDKSKQSLNVSKNLKKPEPNLCLPRIKIRDSNQVKQNH